MDDHINCGIEISYFGITVKYGMYVVVWPKIRVDGLYIRKLSGVTMNPFFY